MKKLLIATSNPGKLHEFQLFLKHLPLEVISLKDAGITKQPDETGKTFEENAILKATYYHDVSGLPTLADDGGFEIDALGGAPGVKSHRWVYGDRDSTDEQLIHYTMEQLKDVPLEKRTAALSLVLALLLPDGMHLSKGKVKGFVPMKPSVSRREGFPYRSLLYIPEMGKFYDDSIMTPMEADAYNHRKRAVADLLPIIEKYAKGTN